MGEQALDQQPERVLELLARGRLGQPQPALDLLVRAAGAQRLVVAARQPQRPQPELAEAVGDRRGRAARRARPASAPRAARASRRRRSSASGSRLVGRAAVAARAGLSSAPAGSASSRRAAAPETTSGGRRARIRAAAAWAQSRFGPAPEPGRRPSARRARGEDRLGPAAEPAQRLGGEERLAGPRGLDRGADRLQRAQRPLPGRLGAHRVGGTRTSAGQRESASASRIPARTPNASAAPEVSPTTCGPPGSGASATGLPSSSRRSPSALDSERRGMRAHDDHLNRTHVRIGAEDVKPDSRVVRIDRRMPRFADRSHRARPRRCAARRLRRRPDRPTTDRRAEIPGGADPADVAGDRRVGADAERGRRRGRRRATSRSRAWPRTGPRCGSRPRRRAAVQRLAALRREPDRGERRGRLHRRHLPAHRAPGPGHLRDGHRRRRPRPRS